MTSNVLKLIACITMLCDHIGYQMQAYNIGSYETANFLRIFGRISFPIFAFLIAEGFKHTKNVTKYALRLFVAGLISEIPYNLCFHKSFVFGNSLNVMFTFFISLVALIFADMCIKASKKEVRFLFAVPILSACYFAEVLGTDYGFWGVLLVFLFYLSDSDSQIRKKLLALPVLLLFSARSVVFNYIDGNVISNWDEIQLFALLSCVPILFYNGKSGRGRLKSAKKYLFYLFYPAHLIVLHFIFSNI